MSKLDNYGLPARILVVLNEDCNGNITIDCVSKRWSKRVGKSNAYNGASGVFAQEANISDWIDTLPKSAFYGRGKDKCFNDGARFYLGSWEFRHMVGGQSD